MVCWSVIAMLKEYLFLALALSALAVLAALTLHEQCCTTRKQKDLEANQEEEKSQPLIQSGQEEIELEVKLESPSGEGINQTGRNELTEESKESVPEHKLGLEDDKEQVEEEEEEKVEINPDRYPKRFNSKFEFRQNWIQFNIRFNIGFPKFNSNNYSIQK